MFELGGLREALLEKQAGGAERIARAAKRKELLHKFFKAKAEKAYLSTGRNAHQKLVAGRAMAHHMDEFPNRMDKVRWEKDPKRGRGHTSRGMSSAWERVDISGRWMGNRRGAGLTYAQRSWRSAPGGERWWDIDVGDPGLL